MEDAKGSEPGGVPIVVAERARSVNFLWGFLTIALGVAVARGFAGATDPGSYLLIGLFGALLVGVIGAWVWFRRHPGRLEISPEAIAYAHRGRPSSARLLRTSGDLYVHVSVVGRGRLRFLKVSGSPEDAVPLDGFDWREVQRACMATGWRFAEGSSPDHDAPPSCADRPDDGSATMP